MVSAAHSIGTPSGTFAHRLPGTLTISAWLAYPAPAHATRSPSDSPRTAAPSSTTVPAELYPLLFSSVKDLRIRSCVRRMPSRRARSTTFSASSGRSTTLLTSDFCEVWTMERSVPELMTENSL